MSGVQYPISLAAFRPAGAITNVGAGGSWLFDPDNSGTYVALGGSLPIVSPDRADPSANFTISKVYVPFVYTMASASLAMGVPAESYNIFVRGKVGPSVAFSWQTVLPPLYNTLTAAGNLPLWSLAGLLDVSPGYTMDRSQRLSIGWRITAGSSCAVNIGKLLLSVSPTINGYTAAASAQPDLEADQGFVELIPA